MTACLSTVISLAFGLHRREAVFFVVSGKELLCDAGPFDSMWEDSAHQLAVPVLGVLLVWLVGSFAFAWCDACRSARAGAIVAVC